MAKASAETIVAKAARATTRAASNARAAADAAAVVLAKAADVAASSAQRGDLTDHDELIRIQGQVENLTKLAAANAESSATRDARLEGKLDHISDNLSSVATRTTSLEIELTGRDLLLDQHRTLWADYNNRREEKGDRQWLIPILVTVPTSILSLITLIIVVMTLVRH